MAAHQRMSGRSIGLVGSGQIRFIWLLPGLRLGRGARRHADAVQPGMPFRRDFAGLGLALVHDPATLALLALGAPVEIIAVTGSVRPDELAVETGEEPGAERHGTPLRRENWSQKRSHYSQRPPVKQGEAGPASWG